MKTWQIQEAKAHLSEVVERAQTDGPQTITRHGKPRAVVLSAETYATIMQTQKSKRDFKDWLLRDGPKFDEFEIERDRDTGRDIDLE
jgi:prevent-host-death family protein